jgi:hypothetical protein
METNRGAKLSTRPSQARRLSAQTLIILALVALACGEALAQESSAAQQQQRDEAPPPMRYMPDDVRRRIEATRDPKERARLGMEIAEERLTLAAQLAGEDRFEAATGEVGIYEAVVEDTIRFLHATGRVNNKLRDIFRHVEITLRSHVTRLESIRRELPERHAIYLKDAIEFVRDNRDQALGIFYDDTVIREPRRPAVTSPTGERATTSVPAQGEAEKKPEQHR